MNVIIKPVKKGYFQLVLNNEVEGVINNIPAINIIIYLISGSRKLNLPSLVKYKVKMC